MRSGAMTSFSANGAPNGRVASMPSLAVTPRSSALGSRSAPRLPEITTRSRSACVRVATAHRTSEEHTSELQSRLHLVCRLLLEKNSTIGIDESDVLWEIGRAHG